MQLCHGGRRAGMLEPWKGGGPRPMDQGGHTVLAPSAIPLEPDWPAPRALTRQNIAEVIQQFADAAIRAQRAGARVIELHGAHGYLIHQFLSPVSNRRDDDYGGSLANRMRFPLEVFEAVRAVWPDDNPIGMRVSATDWIDGGWTVAETIILARALDAAGCDYIHVSSGGMRADQKIDTGPGYQTGFAAAVKTEVNMAVVAAKSASRCKPKPSCAPGRQTPWRWRGRCFSTRTGRCVQRRSSARTSPIRASTNVATRHAGARRG